MYTRRYRRKKSHKALWIVLIIVVIIFAIGFARSAHRWKAYIHMRPYRSAAAAMAAQYKADNTALTGETQLRADAEEHFLAGNAAYADGDFEQALRCYDDYCDAYPADWKGHNNRALALLQLDRSEEALITLMAALSLEKDNMIPEMQLNLLCAAHAQGLRVSDLIHSATALEPAEFERQVRAKFSDGQTIDAMIDSLYYNVIYMQMERDDLTFEPGVLDRNPAPQSRLQGMAGTDSATLLRDGLSGLAEQGDEDAVLLMEYLEALLRVRQST